MALSPAPARPPPQGDDALLAALRAGDEEAFASFVDAHHGLLVRLARRFVPSDGAAEDVAQDTWAAFVSGLDGFQGRSSLRTWISGIAIRIARRRAVRERRYEPLPDDDPPLPSEDAFYPSGHRWGGFWRVYPQAWPVSPESAAISGEIVRRLEVIVAALPLAQQDVLILRDVEGFRGVEVGELLGIDEGHVRVLLHRARTRVRAELQTFFDERGRP